MKKYRVKDTSYINDALVGANTIVELPDDFVAGSNLELVDGGTTAEPAAQVEVEQVYEEAPVVVPAEPVLTDSIQPVEE